jgi:transcriptional regulator with XRE-family HTH domain
MTIAERVKLSRERRGIGQRELAEKCGFSGGYLSQLENENPDRAKIKSPSLDRTRALAQALRVPFNWLAFGEGEEPSWDDPVDGSAAE